MTALPFPAMPAWALLSVTASVLTFSSRAVAAPRDAAPWSRERPIEVDNAGWVLVALPPEVLLRTLPEETDLRVWDPEGGEVPYAHVPQPDPSGRWAPVAITAVEAVTTGWQIRLDTGDSDVPHDTLRLDYENAETTPRVDLMSGDVNGAWSPLAQTTLFRLGSATGLQDTDIVYAPTTDRHLLLSWPRASGTPRLRSVEVHRVEPPRDGAAASAALSLAVLRAGRIVPGGAVFDLAIPGRRVGPGRITVSCTGSGVLGYRLLAPGDGTWRVLAEGDFLPSEPSSELTVDLSQAFTARVLRLDLHAGGQAVPRVHGAWAHFDPRVIAFHASAAGTHFLTYGGIGTASPEYPPVPYVDAWRRIPLAAIGPERPMQPGRLPAAATALGAELPPFPLAAAWKVEAAGAMPGDLVRLEVGMAAYAVLDSADSSALRLVRSGHQIPYARHTDPVPRAVVRASGLQPKARPRAGISTIRLGLPAEGLPLVTGELAAPAEPFRRPVALSWIDGAPGDPSQPGRSVGDWVCPGYSTLPCTLVIPLGPSPGRELELQFSDADDAPLSTVDVTLWRRVDALYFAWPEDAEEGVHLVAVPGLGRPSYDLDLIADEIVEWPHRDATMEPAEPPPPSRAPVAGNAVLAGAIALAALAMIGILARILRGAPSGTQAQAPRARIERVEGGDRGGFDQGGTK